MKHGISQFLVPSPFDSLPFFLTQPKLEIKVLNGRERIFYPGLKEYPQ